MKPSRCHLGLGTLHLVLASRQHDDGRRWLLALLGMRHLAEAAWLRHPSRSRRRLARCVDATHAATAVAWGLSRRDRRPEAAVSVGLSLLALAAER